MFVIQDSNRFYFHENGKIILFETEQEAQYYAKNFIQYATNRLAQEGRIAESMQASIIITSICQIAPVNFDINEVECGVVYARELFERGD